MPVAIWALVLVCLAAAWPAQALQPADLPAVATPDAAKVSTPVPWGPASADGGKPIVGTKHRHTGEWYGWQTLLVDTLALTALFSAQGADADTLMAGGLSAYMVGAPLIHGVHRQPVSTVRSIILRFSGPVVGMAAGMAASVGACGDSGLCQLGGAGIGLMGGAVTAALIDAAVYAYDDEPLTRSTWRVVPAAQTGPNGSWVGLTGLF